jgi:hypothetical protein
VKDLGYLAEYQTMAKRHGGNIVKDLSKALKDADTYRGSPKEPDLLNKAAKELKTALSSLKEISDKSENMTQIKAARSFIGDLKKLQEQLLSAHKDAEKSLKEADSGPSASDLKDAASKIAALAKLQTEWKRDVAQYADLRAKLWAKMEAVVDARWAAITSYAKGFKVSTAGYKGFPHAVGILAEDCAASKSPFAKGVKGDKQTVGMGSKEQKEAEQQEAKERNSQEDEIVEYAQGKVKASVSEVGSAIALLNRLLPALDKRVDEIKKVALDLNKELNDLDGSGAAVKCSRAALALSTATTQFSPITSKAQATVASIWKVVSKEQGIGAEDGAFRDVYAPMPQLSSEYLNRELDTLFKEFKSFKA